MCAMLVLRCDESVPNAKRTDATDCPLVFLSPARKIGIGMNHESLQTIYSVI